MGKIDADPGGLPNFAPNAFEAMDHGNRTFWKQVTKYSSSLHDRGKELNRANVPYASLTHQHSALSHLRAQKTNPHQMSISFRFQTCTTPYFVNLIHK